MKQLKGSYIRESGVSETVGFMLIFGIMVTGIAIVTLYGYPALLQEQQNTNVRNMERNMIVLQNDLKALTYKNVPYKETSLQVAGGTMILLQEPKQPDPHFTVSWGANSSDYYPGEIYFESQDGMTTLSLENGAVHTTYWSSPNGSAMLSEPRWFYDKSTNTFVMTFIKLNASDYLAQTGIGTVRMKLVDTNQTINDVSGTEVLVKYHGNMVNNYNIAWRNYFNSPSLEMNPIDITGNLESTFSLPNNTTKLVIKTYDVTVLSL